MIIVFIFSLHVFVFLFTIPYFLSGELLYFANSFISASVLANRPTAFSIFPPCL
ncbi:hypothetical protein RUMGNA_02146 [Mediterraneibacter gnavus ATCC 29149]|uniref:Uncharacterized protein n=1 Tax=Mediterraneibacter gnavus (strain ATCC 29149 / DSM 114966 / JCM 6515 / VPI C7-9) TaxID=411470 RepID=A7B3L5_MEDG7|nr:hypothetical protein RUMGNA_02146 [Mediterraneibacter gnavus ATCC 29149]